MTRLKTLAAALAASTLLAGAAVAADHAGQSPAAQRETAAEADVGALSADGAAAFRNLHLARLAIFDAAPDQAKTLIGKAQTELGKAKADDAVFLKAEASLTSPSAMKADRTAAPAGQAAAKPADGGTKVAWLPVDGQLLLDDDFTVNPAKAKAVDEANGHLAKGDRKAALDRLKLADVKVSFTMAVVPLAKTTDGVDKAAKLIADGKYYEANAALKQVEDGMRFDVIDATALPTKANLDKAGPTKADGTASTAKPAASATH